MARRLGSIECVQTLKTRPYTGKTPLVLMKEPNGGAHRDRESASKKFKVGYS